MVGKRVLMLITSFLICSCSGDSKYRQQKLMIAIYNLRIVLHGWLKKLRLVKLLA